jgi:hypothetical protein
LVRDISPTVQLRPPAIEVTQPTPLKPTGGRDNGRDAMDVDGDSLGLALGPPLSQGQSATSTQPVKATILPASLSSGHGNATSQSTSDDVAPPPPLPTGTLLDPEPAADKVPPTLKPKLKAKTGTVLKDTGHQTARSVTNNVVVYTSLIVTVSRNFCGLDWMRSNPGGLKSEFDAHFKHLSAEQLKVRLLMFSACSLVHLANT